MTTERVLRTADLPTKFNQLLQIADQYGIPLRDIINQSVGQEVLKRPAQQAAALPPEVMRELQDIRQWRESMETGQLTQTIGQFAAETDATGQLKHEFFNDVRETMADLIEMGRAADMQTAYEQAIWMHPEVRDVMLSRQSRPQNKVAQRQLAATKVSLPAKGSVTVDMEEDSDDLHAMVAAEFRKANTGRL
jgi:hypothetical protein